MSLELLMALLTSAVAIGFLFIYLHKRKFRFPQVILLVFFVGYMFIKFYEGDIVALLFAWFSAVIATSLILDVLATLNKRVDEKLAAASTLIVVSACGVLANVVILSSPASLWIKIFSLAILIAVHVPLLVAVIAYSLGKRAYSKRLVERFYLSEHQRSSRQST
ncbi:MAG: hypothetical protein QXQ03_04475 [Candidatus Nezhaarchaeales archaeon]